MTLPWSEEELAAKLTPLHPDDVAKFFATVIFKCPEMLRHVPDLTEQLQKASDISDPRQQLEVLDWIESTLPITPALSPRIARKPDLSPRMGLAGKPLEQRLPTEEPFSDIAEERTSPPALPKRFPDGPRVISDIDKTAEAIARINAVIAGEYPNGELDSPESPDDGRRNGITCLAHASTTELLHGDEDDAAECILQFSTPVYYAKEGEDDYMVLDVMRLGSDEEEVSCSFHTEDGDGKAGQRYVKCEGKLEFKRGEVMKQISVDIIESPAWSSSLEFKVVLHDEKGCSLGRYLYMCRVKVIDPDCFPSNKFEHAIRANDWPAIPMFKLLVDYFWFNYLSNPIVNRRTKHQLVSDQITNVYFILKLYIGKTVIDRVLRVWDAKKPDLGCHPRDGNVYFHTFVDCPDDPLDTAAKQPLLIISALLIVLPFFLIHFLNYREVFFKIGGTSRKILQGNLVRKFLNYDESARAQMGPSDLIMAMTRDTQSLVHDGYMQLFPLAQNLGKLAFMICLQLYMGAWQPCLIVCVYPVVLTSVLWSRNKLIFRMSTAQDIAQNEMVNYATQVMTRHRLIGDYLRRAVVVEEVEAKVGAFNKRMIDADAVTLNNRYCCKYLSLAATAIWMVVGGISVLSGSSEVGTFVTNLEVFKSVGEAWNIIFDVMLKMQSALPYLEKIVTYMNLPIDLEKRMRVNRRRRSLGEEARHLARERLIKARSEGKVPAGAYAADFVPIVMKNVSFAYSSAEKIYNRMELIKGHRNKHALELAEESQSDGKVTNCNMTFEQGSLVALVGVSEFGKSTLMKLLGAQVIPDSGDLLIPPHLRPLHVSAYPIFFNDTLYNNLTYGVSKHNAEDGNLERVIGICRLLCVSEASISYLNKDDTTKFTVRGHWGEILNTTQQTLLNLARAFIANPEIVVFHKPTAVFDETLAANTIKCMREFVSQKGLLMDPSKIASRRPRTCVMTTHRTFGACDRAFRVLKDRVEEIDPTTGRTSVRTSSQDDSPSKGRVVML